MGIVEYNIISNLRIKAVGNWIMSAGYIQNLKLNSLFLYG